MSSEKKGLIELLKTPGGMVLAAVVVTTIVMGLLLGIFRPEQLGYQPSSSHDVGAGPVAAKQALKEAMREELAVYRADEREWVRAELDKRDAALEQRFNTQLQLMARNRAAVASAATGPGRNP